MRARGLSARALGLAGLVATLACGGSGNEPGSARSEGSHASSSLHKVQLGAEKAAELEKQGARVLGDYGSFKLLQVDDATLESLSAAPGVEVRDDYNRILLNAGELDTTSTRAMSLRGMKKTVAGKGLHIVHFAGPVRPEWYEALKATGVRVVTYLPNNAYLVYGDPAAMGTLERHLTASPAIQWDGEYLDEYKLSPSIQTVVTPTYAIQLVKDEETNGATLELIRSLQSRESIIREALGYVNVVAWLDRKALDEVVRRPDVVSIQPRPRPRKFDERQDMILAGQISGTGPTGPGYLAWLASKGFTQAQFTASGFGVDVSDSGLDNGTSMPNHFGLYANGDVTGTSRVVYSRLEGTANTGSTLQGCDGHGTLNTHIVAGYANQAGSPYRDSSGFSYGLGVAPFVKVGASVVFDPADFTDPDYANLQSRAYRDGMRISSNSWGADFNEYDEDAQIYDALVRDAQPTGSAEANAGNQEMVIVFAAGNAGPSASTVGSPGTAKNVITVGASENVQPFGGMDNCETPDSEANSLYDVASFSSRGPTADGRKKPDIMAPGTHVSGGVAQVAGQRAATPANPLGQALSCFDGEGVCGGLEPSNYFPEGQQWYSASSGTSHATPAVAGAAALVRQYFINQGRTPPSPAMTKAFLMSSARYMTGTGAGDSLYSNNQGTGLMDLGTAFDSTSRLLDDQNPANLFVATGETRTFTGKVLDSSKPFRVTLAWTDAPGSTAASAWKNDLDLTVTVGANTYKGNVFSGANSVTGGTADSRNNVESVFLPAGASGLFSVTVKAANINSDGVPNNSTSLDQDFALVIYNICTDAPPAPTGVTATASGDGRIDVSWSPNGATSYSIYRATRAGGPYTLAGTAAAPPFVDTGLSGGTTYSYVVRGVLCAESPNSNEASAVTTGQCTLPPGFEGLASVNNGASSTCANTLTWSAATPLCGGTLGYSVYRSTTPGFTPSAANRIATGLTGTTFSDDLNLSSGGTYYYVVRATETSTATLQETNLVQKSARPTGPVLSGVRYFDDFDTNRPANASAYWLPTAQSGNASAINLVSGCHYQSATNAYRIGAANTACGGTYPASQQLTLVLGGNGSVSGINGFAIPANAASPQMTFNVWYNVENKYDGAYLVYSTTGASGTWTPVSDAVSSTQPYISAGGYDNPLNSNTSIRVWTNQSTNANGSLKQVTVNLGALAGQTVWFGFRFYSGSIEHSEGFYVDDVRITADQVAACSTRTPPPGPAVGFKMTGLPASVAVGTQSSVTLSAVDAAGVVSSSYSGSVSLTSTDSAAVLPSTATFTGGVATVPVTFFTQGTQSLTATDPANPGMSVSASTTVTSAAATRLVFSVQPSNAVAGASFSPAVKVGLVDAYGNTVTTGSNSVTLVIGNNAGGGTLSGTATVNMTNGVATFSGLSINRVGTGYTLVASSTGLTSATSSVFNITPAAASKLVFVTQPSSTPAGSAITPAVRVAIVDTYGNATTSSANVTLALATNPASATLSGTTTVAAVSGVATFGNLSLNKLGTGFTLRASATSLTSVVSGAFDVTPGIPYRAVITRQPTSVQAGAPITPAVQVTLHDQFGNVSTQATTPVVVSLGNNPSGATLGGTTTVNAVNGVATFDSLSLGRVGSNYTLVAGASGLYSDTSVGFDVRASAPARLVFTTPPPARPGAGEAFTVKVAVLDDQGNTVTSSNASITLTLNDNPRGGVLSGTTTVAVINGVATFGDLSVNRMGSGYTLSATSDSLSAVTSAAFDVQASTAVRLSFKQGPASTTAGATLAPVEVEIRDVSGNLVSATNTISLTLQGGQGGTLGGTLEVPAVDGVATFKDLRITRAAAGYQLTAHADDMLDVTSAAFDVSPGAAAALAFSVQPGATQAGAKVGPAVRVAIVDAFGNVVTSATDSITLTLGANPGKSVLTGTTTVAAVNGVATFADLSLDRAARGYTLQASTEALSAVTSAAFDITTGAPARLVFRGAPGRLVAGASLAPIEVEVQDAQGNVLSDGSVLVSLSLGANPAAGTLLGAAPVSAVNGVARFEGLSLHKAGTGYTLVASAQGFAGATSAAFEVTPGPAASYALALPASLTAGQEVTLSATAYDAYGNVATTYSGPVKVTSSDAAAVLPANAAFTDGVLEGLKVTFLSTGLKTLTLTDAAQAHLTGAAQTNVTPFAQPTVSVTEPAGGTVVSGEVRISATGAVATGTTLSQLSILVDGVVIATGTDATLTTTWDSSKAVEGSSHTVTAVISDSAGNVASSAPVGISVKSGSCGCGATSGTDASIYLGLFVLARQVLVRRRRAKAA
ncbi:S8 family serine peptidase [Archangium violaceum]|nr:S8 family serine peptidase [Archangium violaceum]